MKGQTFWQAAVDALVGFCVTPDDDENERLQKTILILTTIMMSVFAAFWGIFYLFFAEPLAASIPLFAALYSGISLTILRKNLNFPFFRSSQLLLMLLLPFLLMTVLGGFKNGSAVIFWALFSPIVALLGGQSRRAIYWFTSYIVLVVFSGLIHPYLRVENNLPEHVIVIFYILNLSVVSGIAFIVLNYFVGQTNLVIEVMRKNRELEEAYLQQEITLRQSEKLATLGKLSAGVAHELNNPAAAAQRAVEHLQDTLIKLEQARFRLGQLDLSTSQVRVLESHFQRVCQQATQPMYLEPLIHSDRENEIAEWLEDKHIVDSWEYASTLTRLGYAVPELASLADSFPEEQFSVVLASLSYSYVKQNLLKEMGQETDRIINIVKALKSYSYLDQAPIQSIDIHEGLNDTLMMLRSKLCDGIQVRCDYAKDLPRIDAFGSELNQVWTNIIDNAISAVAGQGEIVLKTYQEHSCICVEIADTGPGIPQEIQGKIFDPFFTTKPPGEGAGLGLNISHNIIVQKHKGEITVDSSAGKTRFMVRLPLHLENVQLTQ